MGARKPQLSVSCCISRCAWLDSKQLSSSSSKPHKVCSSTLKSQNNFLVITSVHSRFCPERNKGCTKISNLQRLLCFTRKNSCTEDNHLKRTYLLSPQVGEFLHTENPDSVLKRALCISHAASTHCSENEQELQHSSVQASPWQELQLNASRKGFPESPITFYSRGAEALM